MQDLIEKLEKADKPTVQLFNGCFNALFGEPRDVPEWKEPWFRFSRLVDAEAWTDAALTLVPEGLFWHVACGKVRPDEPLGGAQVVVPNSDEVIGEGEAITPALALCIAALKARLAHKPHERKGT